MDFGIWSVWQPILKKLFWSLYVLIMVIAGGKLFFNDQLNQVSLFLNRSELHGSAEQLTIVYALPVQSFEPTLFDPVTRSRLVDIYEGLVRTDRNLTIEPALALSWGLLDSLTWEFKLRPQVRFHNGQLLTSADVLASLERARTFKDSQLKNLLSSIESVTAIDALTLHITTKNPDPLLLNKLAVIFIFPKDTHDMSFPLGTGPYHFLTFNEDEMLLGRFEDYWGTAPVYQQVVLKTVLDKEQREDILMKGEAQVLADVPPAVAKDLASDEIKVEAIPSLEVNFLMFNFQDPFLVNKKVRDAITHSIDRKKFVDIASGFAKPIGQFVSSGIFGFSPAIPFSIYDPENAQRKIDEVASSTFDRIILTFDYPQSLDVVGQYVKTQLYEIGIFVELNPMPDNDLQKKILEGTSQLYYLGWRSELGDSDDFLAANIHSRDKNGLFGQFNGAHYTNASVDKAIENSRHNLNPKTRLVALQNIMKTIVQDDVVGMPLFESQKIFAFRSDIYFEPRVDGYIYASEIKSN